MTTPTENRLREAVKLLRAACENEMLFLCRMAASQWANSFGRSPTFQYHADNLSQALAATADLDKEPTP